MNSFSPSPSEEPYEVLHEEPQEKRPLRHAKVNTSGAGIRSYFSGSATSLSPSPSPPPMETLSDYIGELSEDPKKNQELIDNAYKLKKKYVKWQIKVTKTSAKWDKIYGIIIFFTVVTLVLVGIAFSIAQFVRAMQIGNFQSMNTELAIRSSEIVLSTSLVGGFVLIASLAFFYLFLRYVYKSSLLISDVYPALNSLTEKMPK